MGRDSDWTPALIVAIALVLAALFLADGLRELPARDRFVEVKGFAERDVAADLAVWPITYQVSAPDLAALQQRIDRADEAVVAFLKLHGFSSDDIRPAPPRVHDRWMGGAQDTSRDERYFAERTLTLRTNNVAAVGQAMGRAAELVGQGVALAPNWNADARFVFTGLEDIKPEMIAVATADARRAAAQFAEDSGSRVGAIRSARQGYFSITEPDASMPEVKQVRVVTTIEYLLEGER